MLHHPAPRLLKRLAVLAVVVASLHGCGGGGGGGGGSQPPPDTTAPSVPTGVTATAQSSTQISVSWQASTDAGSRVASAVGSSA